MRAAVLQLPGSLRVIDAETPRPGRDEVLVRVKATGICSTDLMVYQGRQSAPLPIVPGHEAAGVVDVTGPEVVGFQEGDPVVVEASWGCEVCAMCRHGQEALCPDRVSQGRTRDGTFAEFVVAPTRALHLIPPELDFSLAQALISVACSVRAIRRGRPGFGERAAILGPGIAGLILSQLTGENGASHTTVFGTREWRLAMASSLGANDTVNVREDGWMERALSLTDGQGFDLVFETSGDPQALIDTFELVRTGGRIVVFSIYDGPVDGIPAQLLYRKEVSLVGVRGGGGGYPLAIDLVRSGKVLLDSLVTHRLPLEDAEEGFRMMERRDEGVQRIALLP
ncbi:MAG TPA: hypothetical protein DCP37_00130 [Dehalococcoidia bacterium]|nr:hypothetical protein [Dehalococcoidia bacterium]